MSATTEKWDPRRETYDAFRDRKLREMIREVLAEPEFVALIAKAAAEADELAPASA